MFPRAVDWYATPGPFTDLGERAGDLPAALSAPCRVAQGLVGFNSGGASVTLPAGVAN
jgi:hypothetical protein